MIPLRSPMLWLLLTGLALSLVILFARHDAGTVGSLSTDDFASLAVKIALLVFIGGSALVVFQIGRASCRERV